ncbi:efflux RND transporter periplasmic adaptor subunit [Bremerella sp. T1]|uniref:efflux RND transporter periplasmic adaptor subunit n=1 Tax=Bremerella sp. TYQ1 TaxID=3119568 RepID=UPI001CCA7F62|nr:HlyD family efflux transporter periplasmic adaptor subunit [Bremerella volcania]UBM35127.1 HlyD family efflux transporter periplasmic adaptor subunit [Bremerella volcania]
MSKYTSILKLALKSLISLCLVAGGVAAVVFLGQAKTESDQPPPEDIRLVELKAIEPHESGITFDVDGVVVPYREIQLAAEVDGRVIEKSDQLRVGRVVSAGEPIVLIDRRDYDLELERLQEDLDQAEGNIAELDVQIASAEGQIELAEQNLVIQTRSTDRIRSLVSRNATTESSLDDALRAELTAKTSLQTQRDQLALLKTSKSRLENARDRIRSEVAAAQLMLSRTTIKSPIDGVVVEDNVEQDSYLQKGTLICKIRDTSKLEIKCSLQAHEMKWLWESSTGSTETKKRGAYELPPTPVTVQYRIGNEVYVWDGKISRYDGGEIDQQTRMIPCRVQVENPLHVQRITDDGHVDTLDEVPTLMVGMYVQVDVHVNPRSPLVSVPVSAIYPGNRLWVVKDDKLQRREISVAVSDDETALVYAGEGRIQPGEMVVVSPLASPFDGAKVEVVE